MDAKALAEEVKASILNVNNLQALCELCEAGEEEEVQFVALKETYQALEHLIHTQIQYRAAFVFKREVSQVGEASSSSKKSKKSVEDEGDAQIIDFLHAKYADFIEILLQSHLGSRKSSLQVRASAGCSHQL